MNDQKQHWNILHTQGNIDHYSGKPTDFASEILGIIPPRSNILELGCGAGNDSLGFVNAGHNVLATDFSDVAVRKNSERYKDIPMLHFEVLDMSEPFPFQDNEFDVVYARLSLHYFKDEVTRQIFNEMFRVLKPNGYLCFICKSTSDPLYGKGIQIESDMFELDGHVRHFFSKNYVTSLLANTFSIEKMESGKETFYGNESAFIKVIAKKTKK